MSDFMLKLKQLVFVPKCKCCGKACDRDNLCNDCRTQLTKARIPAEKRKPDKVIELVDKYYCSYYYKDRAKQALTRAKFANPAAFLNSLLTDISIDIEQILTENNIDIITRVPAHRSKFYKQEFDLPREMAKRISDNFRIPFVNTGKKVRKTKIQHKLSLEERKVNLVNAFEIDTDVSGKNILIIEDVITTGITASVYATELKLAAADKVYVWAYTYNTFEKQIKEKSNG